MIGLGFGIWRAYTAYRQTRASQRQAEAANEQAEAANEQARIAQQGQFTNLFSTAVEHLGSEQLPVRLGGIYALWRLIKDSPVRVISVIDILCAFVRHPPHEAGSATKIRPDLQTVLDRLGTQKAGYRVLLPNGYRLDLTGANLRDAKLRGADLTDADLMGANLVGASLMDVNLTGAYLMFADLTGVYFMGANLTGAYLTRANLTGANLTGAYLKGARHLTQDHLDWARISKGGEPPTLPEGFKPPQVDESP